MHRVRSIIDRPALLLGLGAVLAVAAFHLWITPSNPPGYHRDEAALSLNAYTLSTSLRDEDGARLPLFFRSFEDYKSPIYPYLLAGAFRLTGPDAGVARGFSALLVLAATALWAGEYTLSKRALRDLPPTAVALGRMGFGGLFLFGYLVATGQLSAISAFNEEQLGWVGISALLLFGFVTTWYFGLRHVDVSVATSVLVVAFPITLLLGLVAGRTSLGLMEVAGVVTIVFGVVLVIGLGSLREVWVSLDRIVRARLRSTPWR